ncbi:hypothetical protein MJN76_29690, partial [Salmonella enterica subsp. enterica serovar Anatum]|nr:hypothetical protein [Salmonella enterica subsp. enterica serovar Anatum]
VLLCPLYGALSLEAQRKAIVPAPAGMRKVVLATNIAETSLTIGDEGLCAAQTSAPNVPQGILPSTDWAQGIGLLCFAAGYMSAGE